MILFADSEGSDQIEDTIWFFQCKIKFYFTKWTPNVVFSRVAIATCENTSFGVHEWIKISSYTKKIKPSVLFMLLFAMIKILPTLQHLHGEINFFF